VVMLQKIRTYLTQNRSFGDFFSANILASIEKTKSDQEKQPQKYTVNLF